ncbi:ABC transporter ATP-binding protein [Pseudonocardia kongjuensis]|uniref:ABC transporter ATP-binding protein n=1 Tax=Pseudonocardia kongjuensis TaxID=102227 RepID=UPI0031E2B75F
MPTAPTGPTAPAGSAEYPTVPPPVVTVRDVVSAALLRDGRWRLLAAATAGFVLHQLGEAAVPVLVGIVVDRALAPGDPLLLAAGLGALAVTFLVLSLSYRWASRAMVDVFGIGEHALRRIGTARLLHPRGAPTARSSGEVLSLVSSDSFRVAGIAWSVVEQTATLAAVLAGTAALLWISVPLGIGVLVTTVLVLVLMQRVARPLEIRGLAEQRSAAAASAVATDLMTGLRTVQGLGGEDEAARRYREASEQARRGAVRASRSLQLYSALSTAVSGLFLAVLAGGAGLLAWRGDITVGELIAVVGLGQFLRGSLDHVGTFGANWMHKRASARRMHAMIAEPPAVPGGTADAAPADPAAPVLEWAPAGGAPLVVRAGELVGLRAPDTATARAAADRLALRVVPEPGELRAGGGDALDLGADAWRSRVLAVPHHDVLFTGTVRDNVRGRVPADPDPAAAVGGPDIDPRIAAVAVLDDVLDRPGGPDAPVGEAGSRLSGGQRRRLLLARALHGAEQAGIPVVVLDEPATAVDPVTEHRIAGGLRSWCAGTDRAVVLVTASPALLAACDRVQDLR